MPSRYKTSKHDKTRKERKASYIRAKNLMKKYPECVIADGKAYCNHVWEPKYPWVWVDFRFFHTKLKRYFACAMITAEYRASGYAEDEAWEIAREKYPYEEHRLSLRGVDKWRSERSENDELRYNMFKEKIKELSANTYRITPRILNKDYGPLVVGVWATVNRPFIDEAYISDFIDFFRSLGEPTKPGIVWEGMEIEVIPANIYKNDRSSST